MSKVSLENSAQNTDNLLSGVGSWCLSYPSTGFSRSC